MYCLDSVYVSLIELDGTGFIGTIIHHLKVLAYVDEEGDEVHQ